MPGRRIVPLILFTVALTAVAWRVVAACRGTDLFSDDAYYYAIIARNFVETGRFTFDGFSSTHGFHPLLFWLEAAGYAVFGTSASPAGQYLGILIGSAVVFLATVVACLIIACRGSRSEDDTVVRAALLLTLCVVLVPRFTVPYFLGMESTLVLPLLMLTAMAAWRGRYTSAGICALLLVMARLDTLPYVVVPIGLACVWRERNNGWKAALRSGARVGLPAVLGTAVFVAWHHHRFGHPVPIHGALKSCFPAIHLQWHKLFDVATAGPTLPATLAVAVLAVALLVRRGKVGNEARGAGLMAAVVALIQLAVFVLFQKWSKPVPVWYLGPVVATGCFALAVGAINTLGLKRLRPLLIVAVIATVGANIVSIVRPWYAGTPLWAGTPASNVRPNEEPRNLVGFMESLPDDAVWACTDCGNIAFFSGRTVVNLDGLVNDFSYQEVLRDGRLAEYLRSRQVRYLVFLAWDRPQTVGRTYEPMYECRVDAALFSGDYETTEFYVYSYLYQTHSDRLRLPCNAEVWRSGASRDGQVMGRAIVFDLYRALDDTAPRPAVSNSKLRRHWALVRPQR